MMICSDLQRKGAVSASQASALTTAEGLCVSERWLCRPETPDPVRGDGSGEEVNKNQIETSRLFYTQTHTHTHFLKIK